MTLLHAGTQQGQHVAVPEKASHVAKLSTAGGEGRAGRDDTGGKIRYVAFARVLDTTTILFYSILFYSILYAGCDAAQYPDGRCCEDKPHHPDQCRGEARTREAVDQKRCSCAVKRAVICGNRPPQKMRSPRPTRQSQRYTRMMRILGLLHDDRAAQARQATQGDRAEQKSKA